MDSVRLIRSLPLSLVLAAGLVPLSAEAAAPEVAATAQLEEVVVTAQKRAENIQDVPLSIMAVSGEALESAGVRNVGDLGKLVPSLQINPGLFSAGIIIRSRGFGSAANSATDSDVAAYMDGAYIPRPGAVMGSFLDVQNIEVLNGPQGTLFGRNAAMGAISINTNAPSTDKRTAEIKLDAGNFGGYGGTGILNVPLSDNFAFRAAVKSTHTGGVFKNLKDGKHYGAGDVTVGRVSTKWDITPDLSWLLRVDASDNSGDGAYPQVVYVKTATAAQLTALSTFATRFGGTAPVYSSNPSYTVNQTFPGNYLQDRQSGATSDLSWKLSSRLTTRLISSYRDWESRQRAGDTIGTTLDLLAVISGFTSRAQSHELQFISPKGAFLGDKLGFTSGIYYFEEDYKLGTSFDGGSQFCTAIPTALGRPFLTAPCLASPQTDAGNFNFTQHAESTAGYVQFDYALTPKLGLDLGARHTWDKKSGTFAAVLNNAIIGGQIVANEGPYPLAFEDDRTSLRASLSWHASDDVMGFLTYSTGYKSGGFNSGGTTPPLNAARRTFRSETVKDIELGLKSIFLDGHVLLNATLFNTKLDDFQDRSFDGTSFVTRNAGDVKAQGVDIDGQFRPTSKLAFNYGLTYLDATYSRATGAPAYEGCVAPTTAGITTICATATCTISGCFQDLTGQTISYAPKYHATAGVQFKSGPYAGGYEATVALSENFTSDFLAANTNNPGSRIASHATTDLRVSLASPSAKFQYEVYGTNIFDQHYVVATVAQVLGGPIGVNDAATGATLFRATLGDPARFGVRVSAKF